MQTASTAACVLFAAFPVIIYGPIAQLGARLNGIEKVASSNLAGSTSSRDHKPDRDCAIIGKIIRSKQE